MRKIAFINEKGGSAKTTLSVNIAAFLAVKKKLRTLIVDLDPQGQVAKSLGIPVGEADPTVFEGLTKKNTFEEIVKPTKLPNLSILPANKRLALLPELSASFADRHFALKEFIAPHEKSFDYIIFDAPPSLGILSLNIMVAATEVVIPVSLTYLALDGCSEIVDTIDTIRSSGKNRQIKLSLIVPTLYRNTRLANAIVEKLREHFSDKVAKTVIGYNVAIDEAQSHGEPVFLYAPKSKGAKAVTTLAAELLKIH